MGEIFTDFKKLICGKKTEIMKTDENYFNFSNLLNLCS